MVLFVCKYREEFILILKLIKYNINYMFYVVKFLFIFGFKNFYKLKCKFWFYNDEDVNFINV